VAPNSTVFPTLKHTPIQEIMLAITYDGSITLDVLEEFKNTAFTKARMPYSNPTFNANVKLSASKNLETSSRNEGFFLKNAEIPDRALHIRFGSMTLHLLNRYESLSNLIKELECYWIEFIKIAKDITVKSISVRYLNLITKNNDEAIEKYVTIYPNHPFKDTKVDAFTNIRFKLEDASVTLVMTEGEIRNEHGIILDYTVNKNISKGDPDVFNTFNNLRTLKNTVFFKSITDHTINKYQS